jgi:PAS domain S-box-containing protein
LAAAAAGETHEDEGWRARKDGSRFWASVVITSIRDETGTLTGFSNITRDMTRQKRAEAMAAGQNRVLERVVAGAPLPDVLDEIVRLLEEQLPGTLGSILLLDAGRLRAGSAPGLPAAYNAAIDGVAIGSAVGSCGTAAYRREPVMVEDIATDPLWADYRAVALPHGLRACWSTPIFSSGRGGDPGVVLGTFAVYARQPGPPDPAYYELVARAGYLACVAIETDRTWRELRESEARFRTFVDHATDAFFLHDADGAVIDVNRQACTSLGYTRAELLGKTPFDFDPDAAPDFFRRVGERLGTGETVAFDTRHRRKDGSVFPVEIRLRRFQAGDHPVGLALARDITERKRAEAEVLASLREKQTLLREIHHRVKNNLQVVCSLLDLQASNLDDALAAAALRESQDRVRSMALVHEQLYQTETLSNIDFAAYVRSLVGHLAATRPAPFATVRFDLALEPVSLGVDEAVPCGLIISELVCNCLKHAFTGRPEGILSVRLTTAGELVTLDVGDNGVGAPEHLSLVNPKTFGLRLVAALVDQLHGVAEIDRREGTHVRISFPTPGILRPGRE